MISLLVITVAKVHEYLRTIAKKENRWRWKDILSMGNDSLDTTNRSSSLM